MASPLIERGPPSTPRRNGHIGIEARRVDGQVVVRIRDDGVGIAPDMLSHIFGLFAQVPQDLARSQGGLGLGLSIVKALTEKHGRDARRDGGELQRAASGARVTPGDARVTSDGGPGAACQKRLLAHACPSA